MRCALRCALLCALGARVGAGARAQGRPPTLRQLGHTAWTVADGAPASVGSIVQSADGFLWLGTRVGLYRFDGVRFERFEPPAGTPMPSLAVSMLLALPDGALWIGYNYGGASVLDGGRFVTYGEREGLPGGTVTAFARDSAGTMWAATTTGLAQLVGGRWRRVGAERGFPGGLTADLLVDRRGTVWAAEVSGVYVLPRGAQRFARWAPSLDGVPSGGGMPREAPDGSVWGASRSRGLLLLADPAGQRPPIDTPVYRDREWSGLLVDHDRNAWLLGRFGELVRVALPAPTAGGAPAAPARAETLSFSPAAGTSGITPTTALEDREGNVWVGTEGGLDRFRATKLTPVLWPQPVFMPAIAPGDGGALWVGSLSGPLTSIGDRLVTYPQVTAPVTCAYRDLDGGVWFGGPKGLWQVRGGTPVRVALPAEAAGSEVQAIARDRDGTLWLAARGKGTFRRRGGGGTWERFVAPREIGEQPAVMIVADSAGRTWLRYLRSHLVRVTGDSVRVFSEDDGLRVGNVGAIHVRGARVWVGGERGVAVLDPGRGARWRTLSVAGEPLRGVSGIVETAAGDLWLNGADGVTRVPAAEVGRALVDLSYLARPERFDYRDGLDGPAPQIRPLPSAVQGTDGRIWFSTEHGVFWVDPAHLRRNPVVPPVQIRSVVAAGHRHAAAGHVALPKRTTELQIGYTALSFVDPGRVRFRYRLTGRSAGWREPRWRDTSWQDVGARREAIYTNLGPGTYRFQVRAANDDGAWNEAGAAVDFVIPSTFVQTNAFLALCAAAAGAAVWLLLWLRHRQVARALRARFEATLAERTRIAQELHDTLLGGFTGVTAQLYAVRGLLTSRPAEAAAVLARALATADASLRDARHAVWEMRSSALDADDLPDALAAAAREALAATSIDLQLVVRGDRRPLPPAVEFTALRIGREAVANAAKHANARMVALVLSYGPQSLALTVRDDGCGVALAAMNGARHDGHWGVVGMRERARAAGGTLDIAAAPGGGTQVTVSLPLHDARESARRAAGALRS